MAKATELIEQARALEAQGENAKALAIYQHVLPHLDGMPAIKADLSLKAGDLMMKMGNKTGALGMYETAGTQCALHGSSKGVLTVAAKMQEAAPDRTDVLLSLAGQMVKHGHAGPAVDVLIQHAKQANLPEMLQELQPLAGRPSEDVRPQVQMLLDQPSAPASSSERDLADNFRIEPMSLEEQISSIPSTPPPRRSGAMPPPVPPRRSAAYSAPPAPPPPPPFEAPPAPRRSGTFGAPPVPPPVTPSFEPPPPPPTPMPVADLSLDLSPPLPPTARETAAINLRASAMREAIRESELEAPRAPSRSRTSVQRRAIPERGGRGRGLLLLISIPLVLVGAGVGLAYMGLLPARLVQQVKALIPGGGDRAPESGGDSVRAISPLPRPRPNPPQQDSVVPAPPVRERPHAPRAGEALTDQVPPVRIAGLAVSDFSESPTGDRFRVIQRQPSGDLLTLTGRPLADTVGEPAVGEFRMSSLPGDTAVAVTSFEGYVVTVRGRILPAALQALLRQLVARQ